MNLEQIKKWLNRFNKQIQENKVYLIELDTPIGDADHGANMSRGMLAVMEEIEKQTPQTVSDVLKIAAMQLISKVGGASGPLYGTAFLNMSKASDQSNNVIEWFKEGLAGIQKRGKADVGEKTMVDMWNFAINALNENNLTSTSIDEFIEESKQTKASKGRASYVGERSIGHIDPGTFSSSLLFKAYIEVVGECDE